MVAGRQTTKNFGGSEEVAVSKQSQGPSLPSPKGRSYLEGDMRTIVATVILFCLSVGAARATYYISGNMLSQECQDLADWGLCSAYIVGSVDAFDGLQDVKLVPRAFCLGPNITTGQLIDVVKLYLGKHPENSKLVGVCRGLTR